ncbi:MAG: hypothetical protein ACFFDS_00475 [Candidatus Thorarchaeota archaeon]
MSDVEEEEFPLYMSSVSITENEFVEITIIYKGEIKDIDNVYLIGNKNDLSSDITEAKVFLKEKGFYTITFPIWEDCSFQAVVEKKGKYIYEPGEAHNAVFRGKGVFLDLRKIYHLTKDVTKPTETKKKKKKDDKKKKEKDVIDEEIALPAAYDETNLLSLQPKDFRMFQPELKNNLLQLLDYLANDKSQKLILDGVILPDIARSLKICIAEEGRASVYDVCFPVVVFIEKALILSGMIHNQVLDDEKFERYKKEVVEKIADIKKTIKSTEFQTSTELIKKEYDDDVQELKMRLRKEI